MRSFEVLIACLGAVSAVPWMYPQSSDFNARADAGTVDHVVASKENTLNGSYFGPRTTTIDKSRLTSTNVTRTTVPIVIANRFRTGHVWAYIVGLDSNNMIVFVKEDGTLVYPSSGGREGVQPITETIGIMVPEGIDSEVTVELPFALTSGRIYFAQSQPLHFSMVKTEDGDGLVQPSVTNFRDPNAETNWGFLELTFTEKGAFFANLSYVDFFGIIISMVLRTTDDTDPQMRWAMSRESIKDICTALATQTDADGFPWYQFCIASARKKEKGPIRVLSPKSYMTTQPKAFKQYWENYVDRVWQKYGRDNLTIHTQSSKGQVPCQVVDDVLHCQGAEARGFARPTTADIWTCDSGPFEIREGDNDIHRAIVPRLCAAFHRSTLLEHGGTVQPLVSSEKYYGSSPTNHYARIIHNLGWDGCGYTFPYDDVTPDGERDATGAVTSAHPLRLLVFVGSTIPWPSEDV